MKNVMTGRLGGFMMKRESVYLRRATQNLQNARLENYSSVSVVAKRRDSVQRSHGMTGAARQRMAGFTLIELLVVVLIISVLAAIAVPQYQMAVYKARFMRVVPLVNALVKAQEVYYMANGAYSRDLNELDVSYPSSYTYRQTSTANGWAYDTLDGADANIQIFVGYNAIIAYIKNCPVRGKYVDYCVSYQVPYNHAHAAMGKGPSCNPYTASAGGPEVAAFGEKVCLSLGGKKESDRDTKYYL